MNASRSEQLSDVFNLVNDADCRFYAVATLPERRGRTESTFERTTTTDFQKDLFTGICLVKLVRRDRQTIQVLNQFASTAVYKIAVLNTPQSPRQRAFTTNTLSR